MSQPTPLQIHMTPCLSDNYAFLLHDAENNLTAVVDTPEVGPIEKALAEKGWTLTHILNTHHHWDHAGGNLELKQKTGCTIIGPRAEASRIPGIDVEVGDGDIVEFGNYKATVYDTPGHTAGHIVYHFADEQVAFVGDTLFAMGCGRLFEGSPEQMWQSLQKILQWPDNTKLYCAHEYTQKNAEFALSIEPQNQVLKARLEEVKQIRARNTPTIPTTLAQEKETNPFLRPMIKELRGNLNMQNEADTEVFAKTRQLKDNF